MTSRKALQHDARRLFRATFGPDGRLAVERVTEILGLLDRAQPSGHVALLRAYLRLIAKEEARHQARIEHAGPLSPGEAALVAAGLTNRYGRPLTPVSTPAPHLLAGLRVRVGDDRYEFSAAGQLAALAD